VLTLTFTSTLTLTGRRIGLQIVRAQAVVTTTEDGVDKTGLTLLRLTWARWPANFGYSVMGREVELDLASWRGERRKEQTASLHPSLLLIWESVVRAPSFKNSELVRMSALSVHVCPS
jgi:hypothetical protein